MRPFTNTLFMPLFRNRLRIPGQMSVSTIIKSEGLKWSITLRIDHQKSIGIGSKAFTFPLNSLRAISIPWAVVVVKTISLNGYLFFTALTKGTAEITSPTERACIHMLPLFGGSPVKLRPNLSERRRLLINGNRGRERMTRRVHAK